MREPVSGATPAGPRTPGIIASGRRLFVSGQGPLSVEIDRIAVLP
jgi:hypothetical protein